MTIKKKISEMPVYLDGSDEWDNQCEYEEIEVYSAECGIALANHFAKKYSTDKTREMDYSQGFQKAFDLLTDFVDVDTIDKFLEYYEDEIKENL